MDGVERHHDRRENLCLRRSLIQFVNQLFFGGFVTLGQFNTKRLSVHDWTPAVKCRDQRVMLEDALVSLLTVRVLKHLPPSLQLSDGAESVSAWIDERVAESDVLLVEQTEDSELIGLVILSPEKEDGRISSVHIGYLLAEAVWGKGIATELMTGLVSAMEALKPVTLLGGVDRNNPSSARVLKKTGFRADVHSPNPDVEVYIRVIE